MCMVMGRWTRAAGRWEATRVDVRVRGFTLRVLSPGDGTCANTDSSREEGRQVRPHLARSVMVVSGVDGCVRTNTIASQAKDART